ncbi:MAG TPA: hypothetical protein DEF34_07070 [Desulfotomaculum sp.]|nr:MAG: hypothetical protein JL56_04385 [Desulfotomaculum sp. BICA1-6]HBX23372.1 hypothetical protein [Desulfotomaculum sp.]
MINDCGARLVVTADGGWRRGDIIPLKKICDTALQKCPGVESVLVVRRTGTEVEFREGRDYWYHHLINEVESMYEGSPDWLERNRYWGIVEKLRCAAQNP